MKPAPKGARGLAWRIRCNNDLVVTIAVVDKYLLMLSEDDTTANARWRMGMYMDPEDAASKAVEMTGSYERIRKGVVGAYAEVTIPASDWRDAAASGDVSDAVGNAISLALD